jgi:phenylacetate-coenzyme A ligase PaaK-like adenylate-forming protein
LPLQPLFDRGAHLLSARKKMSVSKPQVAPFFSPDYYRRSEHALRVGLESVPAYRAWRERDPGERVPVDRRYAALPELTKKAMREGFPQGLVSRGRRVEEGLVRGEIEYVHTSGTTAERVTNLWNQSWWNASEAASWKLNAHTSHLDHRLREAELASALSVGFRSEADLSMQARTLGRLLFLNEKVSAREWNDGHCERMLRELEAFDPVVLEANPSLLARLSWWALDHGQRAHSPKVIVLTYEFPSRLHVQAIRAVFPSPVVSSFGSTESGYVFMQCEAGKLHQNVEFCRVDFDPLKEAHGGPHLGRILVTTFHNPWACVIRFDVGDLVRLDEEQRCACGRRDGYIASAIEGRVANATFSTAGRLVTTMALDDALAEIEGLRDYQLVQTAPQEYLLKVVARGDAGRVRSGCVDRLRALYGRNAGITIEAHLEEHEDIEPAASGKYRRSCASFAFEESDLFERDPVETKHA